jgi:rare lipoprotein A (peptidoglycan hydrolase)
VLSGRAPAAGLSSRPSDLRVRNAGGGRRGARAAAAAPVFSDGQGRDLFAPTPFGELQGLAKPASADADKPAPAAEPPALAPLAEAPAPRRALGRGLAAWYDLKNRTASGETFDAGALTAGHRTLPFGTKVEVVNLRNGRAVTVKITDRGRTRGAA